MDRQLGHGQSSAQASTEVVNLVYLPKATDDLDRLYNFLAPKNEPAAVGALRAVRDAARSLTEGFPERGTPVGHTGYLAPNEYYFDRLRTTVDALFQSVQPVAGS